MEKFEIKIVISKERRFWSKIKGNCIESERWWRLNLPWIYNEPIFLTIDNFAEPSAVIEKINNVYRVPGKASTHKHFIMMGRYEKNTEQNKTKNNLSRTMGFKH